MSRINALRIINLNYNNNSMHIDDETFRFDGQSTLMSLRNGGGKSVLVQMMIAPFVHKSYRNTKDRPFATFFTTNRPTFIMVEWELDGKAGYVLTGMMVRKSQGGSEAEEKEDLEIINFVSEYKGKSRCDINNLAVIEKAEGEKKLKGFGYCRQLFESLKKDPGVDFNYFDMNNSQQSKRYFEKLKEFQIDSREWETIIKKVNLKESGLSDLFAEAKDEKGLIEKWFMEAVENKLNREKRPIKEFEKLLINYIRQYRENQSKIQRKAIIARFNEEAAGISRKVDDYKAASDKQASYENTIANLIPSYEELKIRAELEHTEIEARIAEIDKAIARTEYEEISLGIYKLRDEKDLFSEDRENINILWKKAEEEAASVEKKIHIMECAGYYRDYQEASRELQLLENRLEIAKEEETELEPERRMLGYNLRCRYAAQRDELSQKIEELGKQIDRDREEHTRIKAEKAGLEQENNRHNRETGTLEARIQEYDAAEQAYNQRFGETLQRNILGNYEPAALELKKKSYAEGLKLEERKAAESRRQKEVLNEQAKRLGRQLEELNGQYILCGEDEKNLEKEILEFECELDERRNIVKYVNLTEDDIFDRVKITEACNRKLHEIGDAKRVLEREHDRLEKELNRLRQGTVMELPKDFKEFLEAAGIHYVYGMEWLRKNGKTAAENEALVDNNPFIPYAIIIGSGDLEKLQKENTDIYTSFPIPIIRREDLGKLYDRSQDFLEGTGKVSFFVLFNKNLLDPEKLADLLASGEAGLLRKAEQIEVKRTEQDLYLEKRERTKNHRLEAGLYEAARRNLEKASALKKELEGKIDRTKDEQGKNSSELTRLADEIPKLDSLISKIKDQTGEFEKLCSRYEDYLAHRKDLQKNKERLQEIKGLMLEADQQMTAISTRISDSGQERFKKNEAMTAVSTKLAAYSAYQEGETSTRDTEDLEARYKAVTEQMSGSIQSLEEQLKGARKRYGKSEKQLIDKANKYGIGQQEYDSITYDEFQEDSLEADLRKRKKETGELDKKLQELVTKIAVVENSIGNELKKMLEKCGFPEPADREDIVGVDFKAVINEKQADRKRVRAEAEKAVTRIRNYEGSLAVFAEYSDFPVKEKLEFTEEFDAMTAEQLSRYNGELRRDYRESVKERTDCQGKLRDTLNRIARMPEFEEEFYKKPLEMLVEVIGDADAVRLQLDTTLQSYESLMEKLAIDIALIDREKEKVCELLLDYILEVHNNLGKIDKNSTINVRGRSIKMLRLLLPDWEENAQLFVQRLKDFVEDLTTKALIAMENNENIEELVGKRITTRNLYDSVVGISRIEIKLYKIEEQREYPITWADVSKNSGGEGFLSAFVILTSLLYYMRRDEMDIFAEKEEGKVLVMDNPFAQTNASHLLKPLMDIAKKTNTQLICLSGLGGDSIYNRFDNIYVLNLVSSNLRKGMQYMKPEHIKGAGEETEEMVLSRVMIEDGAEEVYEQESLF